MYVVTFYSFKGGTGRSMALANVAVELSSRGKRVLMVDFDLEAPGLDTFPFQRPRKQGPGLVEFIQGYLDSGQVPDVREFVYEACPTGQNNGCVWMMPAGKQDDTYDQRFRAIDWNHLYAEEEGFLLFEDLKAQWLEAFRPDYVLIDSRTGHTDIGGICTRQLPDAVVVMFLPNEQNRRGLKPVVDEIREEERGPLKKTIRLHFVMANVPDIDDEEEILSEQMERFEKTLHYSELSSTIHHFNSLAMLDQVIFVLKRPNSKIAREYRVLVESLVRENIEDAQGAIMFLEEQQNFRSQRATPRTALDPKLAIIKEIHGLNPDVLRRLATLRRIQRKPNEALALWDQVIQLGAVDTESLLERAELNADAGKHEVALQDLARLFSLSDAGGVDVSSAVRLQLVLDPKGVAQISKSPLITSVDGDTLTEIARELEISTETLTILEEVFQRWLGNHGSEESEETMDDVRLEYVLCLIGLGRFDKAKLTISETRPLASQLDIYMAFNYAMAEWGASGTPPMDMISQVLVEHENSGERRNANYYQCISLAYYLKDDRIQANEYAKRALTAMAEHSDSTFSSWSYLAVPAERFALEVHDMIDSFSKNSVKPLFISRTSN